MKINNIVEIYRYVNDDGSIEHTPIKRYENDTIYKYRLIADEGYELYYNGENQHCSVLDVFDISGWTQEAIDVEGAPYTYSETDKPIEPIE